MPKNNIIADGGATSQHLLGEGPRQSETDAHCTLRPGAFGGKIRDEESNGVLW